MHTANEETPIQEPLLEPDKESERLGHFTNCLQLSWAGPHSGSCGQGDKASSQEVWYPTNVPHPPSKSRELNPEVVWPRVSPPSTFCIWRLTPSVEAWQAGLRGSWLPPAQRTSRAEAPPQESRPRRPGPLLRARELSPKEPTSLETVQEGSGLRLCLKTSACLHEEPQAEPEFTRENHGEMEIRRTSTVGKNLTHWP